MLRAATAADVDAILDLNRRVLPENFDRAFCTSLLARPGDVLLVVQSDDAGIAAYIAARAEYDPKRQIMGHVYSLGVDPQHRRRGHGRQLLLEAEQLLRAAYPQLHHMMLHVRKSNHAAQALYLSSGYGRAKKIKGYYSDEDGWQMRK